MSTTKANFKGGNTAATKVEASASLAKDLRAEHFKLGNDKIDYKSEHRSTFTEPQKNGFHKGQDPQLWKNNLFLGDYDKGDRYQTSYTTQYIQRDRISNKLSRNMFSDRGSTIVYGSDVVPNQFESEAKANFKLPAGGKKGQLEEGLKKDLTTHH